MTRATHPAGGRRISVPGPVRARAVPIRHQPAEDFRDVRFPFSAAAAAVADRRIRSAFRLLLLLRPRRNPGVMPRVVELFAKRGLVPQRWNSAVSDRRWHRCADGGLDRDVADYIARCMRQIVGVETVLTGRDPPRWLSRRACPSPTISAPATASTAGASCRWSPATTAIGWLLPDNAAALAVSRRCSRPRASASGWSPRGMSTRSAPRSTRWSRRSSSRSRSRNGATRPLTSWRARASRRYSGSTAARCRFSGCAPMACTSTATASWTAAASVDRPARAGQAGRARQARQHRRRRHRQRPQHRRDAVQGGRGGRRDPGVARRAGAAGRRGQLSDGDRSSASATTCCMSTTSNCRPISYRRTATARSSISS